MKPKTLKPENDRKNPPRNFARLALEIVPGSANPAAKTIRIRFYTGAEVDRWDHDRWEPFKLRLDMDSIDPVRINAGGVGLFLDDRSGEHSPNVRDQVGISIAGTLERDAIGWSVEFKLEDVDDFPPEHEIRRAVMKIMGGELNNFSMGTFWRRETRVEVDGVVHVVGFDWMPFEVTAVAFDADPGTTTLNMEVPKMGNTTGKAPDQEPARGAQAPEGNAELGGLAVPAAVPATPDSATLSANEEKVRKDERERARSIRGLCAKFGLEQHADAFVDSGASFAAVREKVLDLLGDAREAELAGGKGGAKPAPIPGAFKGSTIAMGADGADRQAADMVDALAYRMAPRLFDAPANNPFINQSMIAMAGERLERQGLRLGYNPDAIVRAVMAPRDQFSGATPGDFPILTGDAMHKVLMKSAQVAPQKFQTIANRRDLSDMRTETALRTSLTQDLDLDLAPGQLYPEARMSETGETRRLSKNGVFLYLTEELLWADNVGGFADQGIKLLNRYRRLESKRFWGSLFANADATTAGRLMSDSNKFFSAAHANVLAAEAFSAEAIEKLFPILAAQKDGDIPMDLDGFALVVPSTLNFKAQKLVYGEYAPTSAEGTRLMAVQRLKVVSDSIIDTFTTKGFALFADPALIDTALYGWKAGLNGPELFPPEWISGRDSWGYKLRDLFTGTAMDTRGAVYCAGA